MAGLDSDRFACPFCKGRLAQPNTSCLRCSDCDAMFPRMGRIPIFHSQEQLARLSADRKREGQPETRHHAKFEHEWEYEWQFQEHSDPWGYQSRPAERLKYQFLTQTCLRLLQGTRHRVIDVGCGLGLLSNRLAALGAQVTGLDLSPTAACRADASKQPRAHEPIFAAATAKALPIPSDSSDLLVIADGLMTWNFSEEECRDLLRDAARILVDEGQLVLMDYLRPGDQLRFMQLANGHLFHVQEIHFLHDRPWYLLEILLRPLQGFRWCQRFLASLTVARALQRAGRAVGRIGSAHICIVAQKSTSHPKD